MRAMALEPFFVGYIAAWSIACIAAAVLIIRRPGDFSLMSAQYRRYLLQPWKIVTFVLAATGLTLMAPYTGDPTWDYIDAPMMALLTFLTAPWAVGEMYLALRRRRLSKQTFVAACAWLLSASWCYDLYLVFRDGLYPPTWFANLAASSILYLLAGMLWSLEWRAERGALFGFMAHDWPNAAHASSFRRLAWFALPIMVLAGALLAPFLWDGWG